MALDAALSAAGEKKLPVVVTGNGPAALDAVFLVREAELPALWLRTEEKGAPDIDPHLLALILKRLGPEVVRVPLPEFASARLDCRLDSAGKRLERISWPGGEAETACCLWTSPLMARHPLLREDGVLRHQLR